MKVRIKEIFNMVVLKEIIYINSMHIQRENLINILNKYIK